MGPASVHKSVTKEIETANIFILESKEMREHHLCAIHFICAVSFNLYSNLIK